MGKVIRFKEGAVLAVKANEIDTARQAIAAQIQAEKEVEKCRNDLVISESAYYSASRFGGDKGAIFHPRGGCRRTPPS